MLGAEVVSETMLGTVLITIYVSTEANTVEHVSGLSKHTISVMSRIGQSGVPFQHLVGQ